MDIFAHLFVVKIVKFVWKNENKRKRGRGWPILKKLIKQGGGCFIDAGRYLPIGSGHFKELFFGDRCMFVTNILILYVLTGSYL